MAKSLKQQLRSALGAIPHLEEGEGGVFHPDQPGFFVDGRLVVEFVDNNSVGVRLTRPRIRIRKAELASDTRVEPVRSGTDWVAIHFRRVSDLPWIVDLAEDAVGAYVPGDGRPLRPPPTGAALDRLRRFH
ncbi:MAG TPA: luciferase family protein [Acidimicrobiales bacterium]|nr:luciferase family protein [Acidimicrobiales bacterium]